MKDGKKNRPPLPSPRKTGRYRIGTPARERVTVSTKLEQAIYLKLTEAASANRQSISTEVERRLEQSLEPRFANYSLEAFGAHVMAAFRSGGQMAAQDRPYEEWIKDPAAFDRATAHAIEALLSWHPKPPDITAFNRLMKLVSMRVWLPADVEDSKNEDEN